MSTIRPIPSTKRYKSSAFDREFVVVPTTGKFEVWDIETGLSIPNVYTKKADAVAAIGNNFNLTAEQIEYNKTKGIFAPSSIAYSMEKALELQQ